MKKEIVLVLAWFVILFITTSIEKKERENYQVTTAYQVDDSSERENITVTVYDPVESQCDNDPLVTADGSKINLEDKTLRWIALSRDLLENGFSYGDLIEVETKEGEIDGIYEVHDTMHKKFKNKVDILRLPGQDLGKLKWTGAKIRKVTEMTVLERG